MPNLKKSLYRCIQCGLRFKEISILWRNVTIAPTIWVYSYDAVGFEWSIDYIFTFLAIYFLSRELQGRPHGPGSCPSCTEEVPFQPQEAPCFDY